MGSKTLDFTDFSDAFLIERRIRVGENSRSVDVRHAHGKNGAMQSITELAAARQAAYHLVGNSADDESGVNNMAAAYASEAALLSAQLDNREAWLAGRSAICEVGEIDFNDDFVRQMVLRLLHYAPV